MVSRTGFRVFIISILVILAAAIGINFRYEASAPRVKSACGTVQSWS